jgi:carboxylesterase type B
MVDLMMTLWSEFARTGVPSAPGVPAWPKFTPGRPNIMVLGRDIYVAMGIRQREVDAIAAAFERRRLPIE